MGIVPALIAIINSVIAVWLTHFKADSQRLKVGLLLFAIIAGLAAAAATVVGQYHTTQAAKQAQASVTQTLATLGRLIAEGDALLASLRDQNVPVDQTKADAWAAKVEQFLSGSLGPAFVSRFRDSSGLLHGAPTGIDELHTSYWNGIYERIARLQQFSSELSSNKPR